MGEETISTKGEIQDDKFWENKGSKNYHTMDVENQNDSEPWKNKKGNIWENKEII